MKNQSHIGARVPSATKRPNNSAADLAFALAAGPSAMAMQDSVSSTMSGKSGLKGGYSTA